MSDSLTRIGGDATSRVTPAPSMLVVRPRGTRVRPAAFLLDPTGDITARRSY